MPGWTESPAAATAGPIRSAAKASKWARDSQKSSTRQPSSVGPEAEKMSPPGWLPPASIKASTRSNSSAFTPGSLMRIPTAIVPPVVLDAATVLTQCRGRSLPALRFARLTTKRPVLSTSPSITGSVSAAISSAVVKLLREYTCLLYTSDAADEEDSVDLGG